MKTILTAAALSLVAASGAFAANVSPAEGLGQRQIELSSGQDIRDYGSATVVATVGAPQELPASQLAPRDRAAFGLKLGDAVNASAFPGGEPRNNTPR